ncbi:MAG: hypothetical protein RLY98_1478 [Bacteroidota bacterium]|jgi:hypothetical protein
MFQSNNQPGQAINANKPRPMVDAMGKTINYEQVTLIRKKRNPRPKNAQTMRLLYEIDQCVQALTSEISRETDPAKLKVLVDDRKLLKSKKRSLLISEKRQAQANSLANLANVKNQILAIQDIEE